MKTALAILLTAVLTGCATQPTPHYYGVNAPCYSTIVRATLSNNKAKVAGMGMAALGALEEVYLKPTKDNLELLGETCARFPEFSFIQAAKHMVE
ncbi:hypothetical protein CHOED_065 [Vibrio phage CHOED]|uniref:hypothetical protein n=1 Tax=Vibrio phage CHOED TaxID=1458716 RepID=UPI00042F37A6|nr:hypothetical protein CHOED_065 [Vibrio phage CHOED]AHK11925.1 hypothetical protein CHOED_065 [Vibrio phage CHOED]